MINLKVFFKSHQEFNTSKVGNLSTKNHSKMSVIFSFFIWKKDIGKNLTPLTLDR